MLKDRIQIVEQYLKRPLTQKEREIVEIASKGLTHPEIASSLLYRTFILGIEKELGRALSAPEKMLFDTCFKKGMSFKEILQKVKDRMKDLEKKRKQERDDRARPKQPGEK